MGIPVTTVERFDYDMRPRYLEFLRELGTKIRFEDAVWVCDNRVRYPYGGNHIVTLYFASIPPDCRDLVKFYAILRLLSGITARTVKTDLCGLAVYCAFLKAQSINLADVNAHTAGQFRRHLDSRGFAVSTKKRAWSNVNILHESMKNFDGMAFKNPFLKNPYPAHEKKDGKYIPEYVIEQLDRAFFDESVQLEIRALYWVLRLIPSRISELLSIKIDCLKQYMGDYVLFIPTWKQNGGHKEPILRSIHIKKEGMGAYLIDLLEKQQAAANRLQERLPESERGALFTYQQRIHRKCGAVDLTGRCLVLHWNTVSRRIREVCERFDVRDEKGVRYVFTSHQLRHNGITDRLAAGFTIEQVAAMSGHHGDAMLWNAYTHLDNRPDAVKESQRRIISEPATNPYVLFGGRVQGMNEDDQARLLNNLRAHRVRGGICRDISNCKSDMWDCLECASFIPDSGQLPFYEGQAAAWEEKARRFAAFPLIRQNALKNAELFRAVVEKVKTGRFAG
jgi:site-specific recombinase XerD